MKYNNPKSNTTIPKWNTAIPNEIQQSQIIIVNKCCSAFIGYFHILDLINARKMGHIKIIKYYCCNSDCSFDVRGSLHHSIIHTEIASKMQQCIKIYYSLFIWSSPCFGRHTAHHQEPKTALAASGFEYVSGTLKLLYAVSIQQPQHPTTFHICKTRGC
jgi:hypothetical protein